MISSYGKMCRIHVWGASHAPEIGITIEGLPAGCRLDLRKIRAFLDRRKGGRNAYSTKRAEADEPHITSGTVEDGEEFFVTDGKPLTAVFYNQNTRSSDYEAVKYIPRPSHADYTSYIKYGDAMDRSGGGMFSGRMTLPVCFAGAIVLQIMETMGIEIFAHIAGVGEIADRAFDPVRPKKEEVVKDFPVLDEAAGKRMVELMTQTAEEGDSIGGVIECAVTGLRAGVGEPLYDSMESTISHFIFGIPAVKGIAFGSGFDCSGMKGSECNDPFIISGNEVKTMTNHSGGIQGGISNGMPILFKVVMKPTPSIYKEQRTVNMKELTETVLSLKGRHDPCIVPRAVPCIEAACAIAVYDLILQGRKDAPDLTALRSRIDRLDSAIAELLSERMDAAAGIAEVKKNDNLPVENPQREAEVLQHVGYIAGDQKEEYVKNIYKSLMKETGRYEESLMKETVS